MDLAQRIQTHYFDNIAELPNDKQFHFATRIAAWYGNEQARNLLRQLRPEILPEHTSLTDVFEEIINREQSGRRNAHERRQPYFSAYPDLYGVHLALFRLRHMKVVYGIDARESFFALFSETQLRSLCDSLLADEDAMRNLSTFAINTLYLTRSTALPDYSLSAEQLFAIGTQGYDLTNTEDIQLQIYFYTHCIIGESNFYTQTIPPETLPIYTAMLEKLETVIESSFKQINLDNKLEFLVCARICNYSSRLADKIYKECEESISPEGTYLIDIHNTNIQQDRMSFDKSEHRNVLYIMSCSPYQPHPDQV